MTRVERAEQAEAVAVDDLLLAGRVTAALLRELCYCDDPAEVLDYDGEIAEDLQRRHWAHETLSGAAETLEAARDELEVARSIETFLEATG